MKLSEAFPDVQKWFLYKLPRKGEDVFPSDFPRPITTHGGVADDRSTTVSRAGLQKDPEEIGTGPVNRALLVSGVWEDDVPFPQLSHCRLNLFVNFCLK